MVKSPAKKKVTKRTSKTTTGTYTKRITSALTYRALIIGAILSMVVAMYSAYAGLKIGGVWWPITITSVLCLAILKAFGNTNVNEVNIAQTAASSGGLLAAGIIFTIPAIWLIGLDIGILDIVVISLVGGILGLLFSMPLRKEMVEREDLPYPEGTAAAATMKAGDEGGNKARLIFKMFGLAGLFTLLRDALKLIPGAIGFQGMGFSLGTAISTIPFAGGYLIGLRFTAAWFLGAVFSYLIIIPYVISQGIFDNIGAAHLEWMLPGGVGVVIGAAIAYFVLKAIPSMKRILTNWKETETGNKWGIAIIVMVGLLTIITNLNLPLSIIAVLGAFIMAYVGARVTGEMNIDPMEVFAIIVLLAAKIAVGFSELHLVLLAATVCISAGIAGDMMQDLKAGHLLKTRPEDQVVAQLVGIVFAALIIGFVLLAINNTSGIGTADFPAPQAQAVAGAVKTDTSPVMIYGVLVGIVLTIITTILKLGILPIAFGIGLYVPMALSLPLFVGGILRHFVDKRKATEKGRLMAAGLIAGEGFIGVLIALIGFAALSLL